MKNRNASKPVSTPVSTLVKKVLNTISRPYPENITDLVCLAIQQKIEWYKDYKGLVHKYSKRSVNSQIGLSVLQITGLRNLGLRAKATSSLITTYTRLG